MRRLSALVLAFTSVAFLPQLAAQDRTHDITPDDYASVNTITEVAVSPDGRQVAYCLATWDKKADNRKTDLWVVGTDGKGKPKQLTKDRANDRHPKWAADGKAIYVLANRKKDDAKPPLDGKTQVWKVSLEGGDPTAVTGVKDGVTGYDYAPKTDAVFYSIDAKATDEDEFTHLRKKFDKPEYGSGTRTVSEVFRVGKDGKPEKVIAEKRYVREFAVTADGKRLAMVSAIDDSVLKSEGESRVDIYEPRPQGSGYHVVTPPTDVYRKDASTPWAWLENLAWNPDGTKFAFNAIFDAYPAEIIIGELKDGRWATDRMKRPPGVHVHGYGSPVQWTSQDFVHYLGEKGSSINSVAYNARTGESLGQDQWYPRVEYAASYEGNGSSVRVALLGSGSRLPTLWGNVTSHLPTGDLLVDPNPHTKTWKFPTVEHITWKAPDGATVGGPLELPHGWKKGDKPLPLVVAIHGGPTTSSPNDLRFDPHNGRLYFAAKGYAVLCPNYRGSTGYGDKFVTDLIGRENDIEVKDILAGIQHLIKEGIADPERIAVMGWSNGGYLTNCLIALKDSPVKIKAASSGAGIVDTVAEWGFNDEPAYPRVFKKGLPWEQPDVYKKTSPTYQLGYVRTPTLIHVGGADVRCPPGHSRMLHRALKEYVNVPTELVVYPGEPHGLTKLSNRVAKMEWDLAWFEKHLKR